MFLIAVATAYRSVADASIDPDIVDVRSAGHWDDAGRTGTYRVVVRHFGFEEISSRITLEWVSYDTRESSAHVSHSIVFADALLGSVGIKSLQPAGVGARLVLVGPLHNGSQYHCAVLMGPGGEIEKSQGC
jgi:hypothetical protein